MYSEEHKGYLPFPTTTLTEGNLWYDCIDPYLKAIVDTRRSGVAGGRAYAAIKQDPIWQSFPDVVVGTAQGSYKENSRTYKMNTFLRHNDGVSSAHLCKMTEIHHSENFVMVGDSMGYDAMPVAADTESSRFSFQCGADAKVGGDAYVFLRHRHTANICFVDGHAVNEALPIIPAGFGPLPGTATSAANFTTMYPVDYEFWYPEFVKGGQSVMLSAATVLADLRQGTPESKGYQRDPRMPLIWSQPPNLIK
jgi:prepilin-type processing-associated H-X9-DG protein